MGKTLVKSGNYSGKKVVDKFTGDRNEDAMRAKRHEMASGATHKGPFINN